MANIDNGFRVEVLSLDDLALIASGLLQPDTGLGFNAPQGSLYLRQDGGVSGEIYAKFGPADVDWRKLTDTSNIPISSVATLSDVVLTNLTTTDILQWDGTSWVNIPVPGTNTQLEVDAIELGSGGIFNSSGNFDGTLVGSTLTTVITPTDLLDTLAQIEAAIPIPKEHFHSHNGATTQTLTATFVTLLMGIDVRSDPIYTNVTGEVTINKSGNYKLIFDATCNSTGSRSTSESKLQINGIDVAGTFAYGYHRNSNSGHNTASSASLLAITAGDTIRVQIREVNGTVVTTANACRLTISEID